MSVSSNQPKIIVDAGAKRLSEDLQVSNLITHAGLENFGGKVGSTVELTVPGVLPYREYAWGNDRSQPIITDDYTETLVNVTIGTKRPYSAVRYTDEDEYNFEGEFGRVFNAQMDAVGRAIEDYSKAAIINAPYERVINIDTTDATVKAEADLGRDVFHNAFVDAKSAISRMLVPFTNLVAVCSDEFADKVEKSQKIVKNQGLGDDAFGRQSFGSINGIQLVRANWVPAGLAYLFDKSAFVLRTATPRIPNSVPFGATGTVNGFSLSWLKDYDSGHLEDRSVFHCYAGATHTLDNAKFYAPWVSDTDDYFVRGIVIGLDGAVTPRKPGDGGTAVPGGAVGSTLAKVYNKTLENGPVAGEGTPFPDYLAHPAPEVPETP